MYVIVYTYTHEYTIHKEVIVSSAKPEGVRGASNRRGLPLRV